MAFNHTASAILQVVNAPKTIVGKDLDFKEVRISKDGHSESREARVTLEMASFSGNLEWIVKAGRVEQPATYVAVLILDGERIRGIDYSPIEQRKFYKITIPKGWHQNVRNPNTLENRHEALTIDVLHLHDFCDKVAKLWHIDYEREGYLL
jgi:hypothetical protein